MWVDCGKTTHSILHNLGKVEDYTPEQLKNIGLKFYELEGSELKHLLGDDLKKNPTHESLQILLKLWFPLKNDKNGGGSEKDRFINKKFCSMCYVNGKLLTPTEIDTAAKIQKFRIREIKKMA
jgi:hypothetical protein